MYFRLILLGACATGLALPATAQDATDDNAILLDTIVIEGSRLGQTANEVGTSVSVITAKDIEKLGFDFASDAIASAPGVTVNQNGPFGGQATVRIRGASSEQTLVLIDGVPVNDPSTPGGGFNFARLDTENIERIEILKGPQSTLWGSDAIGGVVSITTKQPITGFGGTAFTEYGSYNTIRSGGSVDGGNESGNFRLAVTGTSSNGISKADEDNGNSEEDGFKSIAFSGKGGVNLPNDARVDANVRYTDSENEFDSYSGAAQGKVADGDELSKVEELSGNLSLDLPLFDSRMENTFSAGYSEIRRRNYTAGVQNFSSSGERKIFRYQGAVEIDDANKLGFGAEREISTANSQETSINGFFALYEAKPVEGLTVTGGIRLDDHKKFGSETTGRVAAAYTPVEEITLRASWGQGFKAPTLFQTTYVCCGATVPNADLKPEKADAFDIGVDLRTSDGKGNLGITYFDQDTKNLISFSFAGGGYFNIAEAHSRGIEVFGGYDLTDWLNVAANYAYIDAEDSDGKALERVPQHSGDLTASFDPQGAFSGAILVRYNGQETDANGTVAAWSRVDANAAYELSESVEVFGRVENLFDTDYQQILGYGTPGLSGSLGLRLVY